MHVFDRIVLGTRGSELARAQTQMVQEAIRTAVPELQVEIEIITTRGDEKSERGGEPIDLPQGRKGLFTKEIEQALLAGKIDIAVHSAKDLPSEVTPGLEITGALPRAAVEDVLVTKTHETIGSLPAGATIATGSVRRQSQLRWLRADLRMADLRGNVPTRLRKLKTNAWDGIILARAGLERLGFACAAGEFQFEGETLQVSILPAREFLPAGGQGIIALQARTGDGKTGLMIENLRHAETLLSLRAEREFLRLLQGDCGTPVGVLAEFDSGSMTMRAQIFDQDSARPRLAEVKQARAGGRPEALAAELWDRINGR